MDVAVSPTSPQTVLAITAHDRQDRLRPDRGIWRTTDGGINWVYVHQFPQFEAVGQLAWAPQNDRLVFAAGGSALARSRDGGATFQDVLRAAGGFPGLNRCGRAVASERAHTTSARRWRTIGAYFDD